MNLDERIEAFTKLGVELEKKGLGENYPQIRAKNDWFTKDMVDVAFQAIYSKMLKKEDLEEWTKKYTPFDIHPKRIALILAGNIPAVGFHDILSVLISGHNAIIKLSSKDPIIIPYILEHLIKIEPRFRQKIDYVERLNEFDAVIATGSSNSNVYFSHYFDKYPRILRSNRKSVGVIFNDTTDEDIIKMGDDIFLYYGLGCRNISKLFIEKDVNLENLMKIWHERNDVILHNKYKNNYDYNYTISLLNEEDFLMSGSMILKKANSLHSRIATIHYEEFTDIQNVIEFTNTHENEIQCIVSPKDIPVLDIIAPGKAQFPLLTDYADHIDTLDFLIKL